MARGDLLQAEDVRIDPGELAAQYGHAVRESGARLGPIVETLEVEGSDADPQGNLRRA
jgi:hypothetical protein